MQINAGKIAYVLLARAQVEGGTYPVEALVSACADTLAGMKDLLCDNRTPEQIAEEIEPEIRRAVHNWEHATTI